MLSELSRFLTLRLEWRDLGPVSRWRDLELGDRDVIVAMSQESAWLAAESLAAQLTPAESKRVHFYVGNASDVLRLVAMPKRYIDSPVVIGCVPTYPQYIRDSLLNAQPLTMAHIAHMYKELDWFPFASSTLSLITWRDALGALPDAVAHRGTLSVSALRAFLEKEWRRFARLSREQGSGQNAAIQYALISEICRNGFDERLLPVHDDRFFKNDKLIKEVATGRGDQGEFPLIFAASTVWDRWGAEYSDSLVSLPIVGVRHSGFYAVYQIREAKHHRVANAIVRGLMSIAKENAMRPTLWRNAQERLQGAHRVH